MNGERASANLPRIYLETTLFNYFHLSDPARRTEIDATKRLFEHVRERRFDPYVSVGAIPPHKMDDALHIAIASLSRMDILASWNCSHIVRYRTQQAVHDINLALGISPLAIHTPLELIY